MIKLNFQNLFKIKLDRELHFMSLIPSKKKRKYFRKFFKLFVGFFLSFFLFSGIVNSHCHCQNFFYFGLNSGYLY